MDDLVARRKLVRDSCLAELPKEKGGTGCWLLSFRKNSFTAAPSSWDWTEQAGGAGRVPVQRTTLVLLQGTSLLRPAS